MYELVKLNERSYYIESPAKVGIYKISDSEVCLIDSGNDKDMGKKIKKILEGENWTLKCILNTHSHADHIGGNQYLQKQYGCEIFAPKMESAVVASPVFEPISLYGGCPPKALRHKFLMAQPSEVKLLTEAVLPEGLSVINLPGHSFDMVGFRDSEGVVFLADALCSAQTLEKYPISFFYDVEAYLESLESLKTIEGKLFVPSHVAPTEDIAPLAQLNIDKALEIGEKIVEILETAMSFDALLQKLFQHYDMTMSIEQYVLVGGTVKSYLSYLLGLGKIAYRVENSMIVWCATQ